MKLASLKVGLHLTLRNAGYRIVRIIGEELVQLERISDSSLHRYSKRDLQSLFVEGELVLSGGSSTSHASASQYTITGTLNTLPDQIQVQVMKRLEYVKTCIRVIGNRPTTKHLTTVIEKVSSLLDDLHPPTPTTLYRWWKTYSEAGNDVMALADKKPGKAGVRAFKSEVMSELQCMIDEVYLHENKPCKQKVYQLFKHRMQQINMARLSALRYPSQAQFYRIMKRLNQYDVMAAREGKYLADNHFRASGGGPIVKHILERVEVDHTVLDIILVDKDTDKTNSRPTLTLIIDVYSRYILGVYIGFEPASQVSVMRAMRQAILPKVMTHEQFKDVHSEWKAFGKPATLICDNGLEFHSKMLKHFCGELGIDLQYCPRRDPRYKGVVERVIGTLNRQVCHTLPGTTFSNVEQRKDYKSEQKACITLEQLQNLIYRWIVDIYHQQIHRVTKQAPASMWKEGLQVVEPLLPESVHQLNMLMTKEDRRTLTHKGIEIYNQFYNSAALRILRERKAENYEVTVYTDSENIGFIWVYDDVQEHFIQVSSTTPEYSHNLSLRQHQHIRKNLIEKGLQASNPQATLSDIARFHEDTKRLEQSRSLRERKKAAKLTQKGERPESLASHKKELEEHPVIDTTMYDLAPEFKVEYLEEPR